MKKFLTAALLVALTAGSANAQGTVTATLVQEGLFIDNAVNTGTFDIFEVTLENTGTVNIDGLTLSLPGPLVTAGSEFLTPADLVGDSGFLPAVAGLFEQADSFFVVPEGPTVLAVGSSFGEDGITTSLTLSDGVSIAAVGATETVAIVTVETGVDFDITAATGEAAGGGGFLDLTFVSGDVGGGPVFTPEADSTIDLSALLPTLNDILADAVTIVDGTITDAVFASGEFFDVDGFDADSVDVSFNDTADLSSFAADTLFEDTLTVTLADGSTADFTVTAVVPEPATFGLAGLALVGLAGLRRRS